MRIIGVNFPEFRKNGGAIVSAVYVLNAEGFERKSPPENLHVHFETYPQSQGILRRLYGCEQKKAS